MKPELILFTLQCVFLSQHLFINRNFLRSLKGIEIGERWLNELNVKSSINLPYYYYDYY